MRVFFHSFEWSLAVEAGWITWCVDRDGWAYMVRSN